MYFSEIGDPGDQLLGFLNSLGVGGVLRLGYVGDLLFFVTSALGATTAISFQGFQVFLFLRKIELAEGRVVAKESHSLFGGLQLSTQAKSCEMRPHPASKKTEGGRARLGREEHVVSKYSESKSIKSTYLVYYNKEYMYFSEYSLLELLKAKVMSK